MEVIDMKSMCLLMKLVSLFKFDKKVIIMKKKFFIC